MVGARTFAACAFLGKLKTNRVDWWTEADLAVRIWLTLLRDADCTDN